ncbi:hypothetical protein M5K25_022332 [Dendrobium thyrsiflorum]|uniref:Uncharacterized protein n=1 Tax=Dendrobium thyrsiflorum TaxID=117978 RepID=A0ABD0UC45_DENTH
MAVLASFSLPAALSTLTGNRYRLSRPARLTSSRQFPHRQIVLRLQSRRRSSVGYWVLDVIVSVGSMFTDEEQEAVVPASVPVRVAHELLQAGHRYLDVSQQGFTTSKKHLEEKEDKSNDNTKAMGLKCRKKEFIEAIL